METFETVNDTLGSCIFVIFATFRSSFTSVTASANSTVVHSKLDYTTSLLGAIHLWRPHGGGRGQAEVDACGQREGVQPHVDVHTEN